MRVHVPDLSLQYGLAKLLICTIIISKKKISDIRRSGKVDIDLDQWESEANIAQSGLLSSSKDDWNRLSYL